MKITYPYDLHSSWCFPAPHVFPIFVLHVVCAGSLHTLILTAVVITDHRTSDDVRRSSTGLLPFEPPDLRFLPFDPPVCCGFWLSSLPAKELLPPDLPASGFWILGPPVSRFQLPVSVQIMAIWPAICQVPATQLLPFRFWPLSSPISGFWSSGQPPG